MYSAILIAYVLLVLRIYIFLEVLNGFTWFLFLLNDVLIPEGLISF